MAEVVIRVGSASEIVHEERRVDAAEFVDSLRASGFDVELDIPEYVPGRRGLHWVEGIAMFVVGGAGGTVVSKITADLYDLGKAWAIKRWRRRRAEGTERPVGFTIYGPKGEVLRHYDTREEDE